MIYNEDSIEEFNAENGRTFPDNRRFFDKLRNKKVRNLDPAFHKQHDDVFDQVDCLKCANCCKTTSPIFTDNDIDRIAKHLKVRPVELIAKHLHLDADKDYVLNTTPCTFLGDDNYCSIYDIRPRACREYPHTDRKNIAGLLAITLENTKVCPAVFEMVDRLKKAGLAN